MLESKANTIFKKVNPSYDKLDKGEMNMFLNRNCCGGRQMAGAFDPGFAGAAPEMECPVVEPTTTNCVEREFYHEVPHL